MVTQPGYGMRSCSVEVEGDCVQVGTGMALEGMRALKRFLQRWRKRLAPGGCVGWER